MPKSSTFLVNYINGNRDLSDMVNHRSKTSLGAAPTTTLFDTNSVFHRWYQLMHVLLKRDEKSPSYNKMFATLNRMHHREEHRPSCCSCKRDQHLFGRFSSMSKQFVHRIE